MSVRKTVATTQISARVVEDNRDGLRVLQKKLFPGIRTKPGLHKGPNGRGNKINDTIYLTISLDNIDGDQMLKIDNVTGIEIGGEIVHRNINIPDTQWGSRKRLAASRSAATD